jgi:uncharacterized protein (UPF0333 family)
MSKEGDISMKNKFLIIILLAAAVYVVAPVRAYSQMSISFFCENIGPKLCAPNSALYAHTWVTLWGSGFLNGTQNETVKIVYPLFPTGAPTPENIIPEFSSTSLGQINLCLQTQFGPEVDGVPATVAVGQIMNDGSIQYGQSLQFTMSSNANSYQPCS